MFYQNTCSPANSLTEEWTPLEPGVVDHKLSVRGDRHRARADRAGGDERNELVSVTRR